MGLTRSPIILSLALTAILQFTAARAESDPKPAAQYVSLPKNHLTARATLPPPPEATHDRLLVRRRASLSCLPGSLKSAIADIAARFGPISIESTHRDHRHNRRAGGARQSLHLSCRAVDLRARGRSRGLMAYLRSRPDIGGIKLYGSGIIHIDNGQRRTW